MTTQTAAAHTPAPWYTMERGENHISIEAELYDGAAKPATIATVNNCIMAGEANAVLIAAAPDLLAALEAFGLPDSMERWHEGRCAGYGYPDDRFCNARCQQARAAIRAAKGDA